MLARRFRCSGLAALRSGSACPRMTSGFCRRQLRLPAGMVPELAVARRFPSSLQVITGLRAVCTPDVRPRRLRPPAQTRTPPPCVTTITKFAEEPRVVMVMMRAGQMGLVPEGQDLPRGWRRAVRLAAAASGSPQGRQFARDGTPPGHASRCGGREPAWRHRLSGHFSSAHRNDGPPMLLRLGGQPQPWAIVAAAATSMGHRCGCPARLNSIDVPSLLLPARVIAADRNPDAPRSAASSSPVLPSPRR